MNINYVIVFIVFCILVLYIIIDLIVRLTSFIINNACLAPSFSLIQFSGSLLEHKTSAFTLTWKDGIIP